MSEWTSGRLRTYITGVLRSGFRKFPAKYETLKEASVGKQINNKTGRLAEHFKCKACNGEFPAKQVNVDHLEPVVCPIEGFINWDVYIRRMFCGKENLQVLCTDCHDLKSLGESKLRKDARDVKKKKI